MYLWLSTWRSHVDRQCPPLLHYPPQQCRWSAALFPHWITTDQHSISMKCNIRAPLYCTCFVALLVHFPCFDTTYKYCSVIEGFTLPVHSKQRRWTLLHSSVNEVVLLPLHCPYCNSTSICSYYTSKSCEDFLGIEGWKKCLHFYLIWANLNHFVAWKCSRSYSASSTLLPDLGIYHIPYTHPSQQ